MPVQPRSVLLVDDHDLVRAGFRRILEEAEQFEVVGEAGSAAAAIEAAQRHRPDLILMDLSLPDTTGIEAIASIREFHDDCRIVMLSQYDRANLIEEALEAGASGYVLKTASADELLRALEEALSGSRSLSPEAASRIVASVAGRDSSRLTTRETEVLRLVAEGMSSKQIAAELHISPRTAETHRANVMSKLGFNGVADLVRFAVREGFVAP